VIPDDVEPTAAELAQIEREWPLIAAEVAVVEAEILALCAKPGPSELDWQRLRRARRRVLREAAELYGRPAVPAPVPMPVRVRGMARAA
jgi:Family of unknown function (DUF6284)